MPEIQTQFIPAGRTGLIEKDGFRLQVQTEYAPRPIPRISSNILCSGELLHKIEIPLDDPIENRTDMERAERLILLQHAEVLGIVREASFQLGSEFPFERLWLTLYPDGVRDAGAGMEPEIRLEGEAIFEETTDVQELETGTESAPPAKGAQRGSINIGSLDSRPMSDSEKIRKMNRTTLERLYIMEGVDEIVTTDWRGNFLSEKAEKAFKKKFKSVYRHLGQALEVFPPLPGDRGRSQGIYEVEPRKLYMVSHCGFVYFVIMRKMPFSRPIEEVIREALDS